MRGKPSSSSWTRPSPDTTSLMSWKRWRTRRLVLKKMVALKIARRRAPRNRSSKVASAGAGQARTRARDVEKAKLLRSEKPMPTRASKKRIFLTKMKLKRTASESMQVNSCEVCSISYWYLISPVMLNQLNSCQEIEGSEGCDGSDDEEEEDSVWMKAGNNWFIDLPLFFHWGHESLKLKTHNFFPQVWAPSDQQQLTNPCGSDHCRGELNIQSNVNVLNVLKSHGEMFWDHCQWPIRHSTCLECFEVTWCLLLKIHCQWLIWHSTSNVNVLNVL